MTLQLVDFGSFENRLIRSRNLIQQKPLLKNISEAQKNPPRYPFSWYWAKICMSQSKELAITLEPSPQMAKEMTAFSKLYQNSG